MGVSVRKLASVRVIVGTIPRRVELISLLPLLRSCLDCAPESSILYEARFYEIRLLLCFFGTELEI